MPYATVVKKSVFDSAHRNTGFGEGHKCNRIHGHTFNYEVAVRGQIDPETGLTVDFGIVKEAMKESVDKVLDHYYLNEDVEYFKTVPPSAENIAIFIFKSVRDYLRKHYMDIYIEHDISVEYVKLHETPTSTILFTREDF